MPTTIGIITKVSLLANLKKFISLGQPSIEITMLELCCTFWVEIHFMGNFGYI